MFGKKLTALRHESSLLRDVLGGAGISRSEWSHPALQASFVNELIRRRKLYSAFFGPYLNRALQLRLDADYRPKGVSLKQATQVVRWAQEFVATLTGGVAHGGNDSTVE
jgi:mannitol/fructose-specific phosphotransferase system IIA component